MTTAQSKDNYLKYQAATLQQKNKADCTMLQVNLLFIFHRIQLPTSDHSI